MSRFAFTDELEMLRDAIRNTGPDRAAIRTAARYAAGVVDGYYRAGAITQDQRDEARMRLRGAIESRVAVLSLERAARAEGLA